MIGLALVSLLAGCGNQSASNAQTSTPGSNSQSGQHRNEQGFVQMLVNAGASQSDAQNLENLIRQTNTDPKWVLDQLKNKVSVSDITNEINSGKAPKRQWNGNHQQHSTDQQSTQ
ncbi:MAG: hypothetical protein QJR01_05275 [Kyrpidia sp.]|nr:hypothetical protein [Kyrpidia sp.]